MIIQFSGFFNFLKNQHFQIPIQPGIRWTKNHFVDVLPPNHYLFTLSILLFNYKVVILGGGLGGGGGVEGRGENLCSLKDGMCSWPCSCTGMWCIKKAYQRKTSFTSSSLNGHIPPDTKTNAFSSPGIITCLELPSAYVTSLSLRSCITASVRWLWQQIRCKISGICGRK